MNPTLRALVDRVSRSPGHAVSDPDMWLGAAELFGLLSYTHADGWRATSKGILALSPCVAAILSNEARGFQPPGRLDWTDARGRLHRVRCVRAGNTWAYSDRVSRLRT